MDVEESIRIHLDWWGQCRTCKNWSTEKGRMMIEGECRCDKSPFYSLETWRDGRCGEWETFDPMGAEKALIDARMNSDE